MDKIIQKAIEGGFKGEYLLGKDEYYGLCWEIESQSFLLDPLFWQALGKACGWENSLGWDKDSIHKYDGDSFDYDEPDKHCAYCQAMHFHEINLTEGWEKAVEYLNELVK